MDLQYPKLVLSMLALAMFIMVMPVAAEARPGEGLAARLQADGMIECWNSMIELQACTGEVILFFLNGQTYLGPSCCRAIRVIEHRCWAADALLTALGFTVEEGDVLRDYCYADSASSVPATPAAADEVASTAGTVAGGSSLGRKGLVH